MIERSLKMKHNFEKNKGGDVQLRMLLMCIVAVGLAGCATSAPRRPTEVNNLQFKIAQMERKLNESEQQMQEMRYEIERMSLESENSSSYNSKSYNSSTRIEEPIFIEDIKGNSSAKSSTSDDQIIRVSASPQSVQKALKNAGYYSGAIDGKLGKGSQKAIKEFQSDHSLKPDGVVGRKTWDKLASYLKN